MGSPTANVSVTAAFAFVAIMLVQFSGLRAHGVIGWIRHYFQPYWWFFPLNLLELVTRPLTLALRLYGNIYAGEVLLRVFYNGFPAVAPVIWLAFSAFIGLLQAYIFTALSLAYTGTALEE